MFLIATYKIRLNAQPAAPDTCYNASNIINANVCEVCMFVHAKSTERIRMKLGIDVDYSLE